MELLRYTTPLDRADSGQAEADVGPATKQTASIQFDKLLTHVVPWPPEAVDFCFDPNVHSAPARARARAEQPCYTTHLMLLLSFNH